MNMYLHKPKMYEWKPTNLSNLEWKSLMCKEHLTKHILIWSILGLILVLKCKLILWLVWLIGYIIMRTEDHNYGTDRDSIPKWLFSFITWKHNLHSSQLGNYYPVLLWATNSHGSSHGMWRIWHKSISSYLPMGSQFCHFQMWRTIF